MDATARRWDGVVLGLLIGVFLVVGGHIIRQVIAYPLPGGWDGTAHYAVTELYVRNHFPVPDGWMPEYFGGMAFPDYYPPLLYWVAGGLAWIGVPTATAIDAVFLASTVAVLWLSYSVALRLSGSRLAAALAGIIVIQLLVDGGEQARFGIAIRGTFSVGLASHVVGYALLLASIRMALARTRRRRVVGTAVFLALSVLANLHITLDAALIFAIAMACHARWAPIGERLDLAIAGAIALAASCMFWLPLLAEGRWLPTYSMPPRFPGAAIVVPMAAISVVAGWWALRARHAWTATLAAVVLVAAALCVVNLSRWFPDAPLQPWRVAAAGIFLAPVALAAPVARLVERGLAGKLVVAAAFVAYSLTFHRATVYEYPLTTARERSYDRVFALLRGRPSGRVLVENGGDGADAYALQVLLPLHGHDSATGVFREASLGSLFAVPLQTRFSESARVFGIDSKVDPNLLDGVTDPERLSGLLRAFDITHVVVHSQRMKALVGTFPGARLLGGTDWAVYELPWPSERVVVAAYDPILVAAPFTVKRRTGSLDYVRLSEELLARGVGEYTTALQHGCALTDRAELARFRVVLVLERCGGADRVAGELGRFVAGGGTVIANQRAVADLPRELVASITVIDHDDDALRFYDGVVTALRAHVRQRPLGEPLAYRAGRTAVALDVAPGGTTPVVIRTTYHPSWVTSRGAIYMSTFAQTLVLVDGPAVVSRERSASRQLGLAVTLFTLLAGLFAWRRSGSWR